MEKKLQQPDLTNCNILKLRDLCQAYYKILLVIMLTKFIKSNANMDILIKQCETRRTKYKCCEFCLQYINVKR